MLEEKDRWDIMLVMKMDRIHRNSKNFMIMMESLEKWGKKFTSMNESLDTSNAVGRFVVDIIQRIAQLESEQIGERTYMGMRQKAESMDGMLGFNPPFGYHMDGERLVVVEAERPIVQSVYSHYLFGKTAIQIARCLNQDSILTRRGKEWTVWSIGRMLHNPVYAGFLRWDGLVLPSDHEAIIGVDMFNQVQARMASRARRSNGRGLLSLKEDLQPFPMITACTRANQ
jgi:DNA invertase Pin-like site-specific DNA recombinase